MRPALPGVVVTASGGLVALTLQAADSRQWKYSFLSWDLLLVLLTCPVAALLLWRVLSAALAAWSHLDMAAARRLVGVAYLTTFVLGATLAGYGSGFGAMAAGTFAAALAWLFWIHRPAGFSLRALEALRAGAEAFRHPLAVVLLALLLVDVRLLHLSADPPVQLGPSGGAWADPAVWAHNARNKVLYGQWVWDEVNFMYVSPVTTLAFYLVFRLLGVGYAQVGLVAVLFSLAALPLLYASLREAMGRGGALLATCFLGGSYYFIMYNRIGLVETPAIFFHVLTLYFGQRGTKDERFFALAGVSSLIPVAIKMQMAYVFPAAFLSVLLWGFGWPDRSPQVRSSLRPLGYFLAGAGGTILVLSVLWLAPYWDQVVFRLTTEWHLYSPPLTVPRLVRNVLRNPFVDYFRSSPVLLLLSGWFFCRLLLVLITRVGRVSFSQLFTFWWFAGGFVYLSISQYRPLRYYVSLFPPMAVLAAFALVALWRWRAATMGRASPVAVWVYGGGLFVAGLGVIEPAYARSASFQRFLAFLSLYPLTERELIVLVGVCALLIGTVAFRFLGAPIRYLARLVPPWAPHALAIVLAVWFFWTEGRSYLDWKLGRDYKLVSISRQLGKSLPEGSVIAGIFSRALTLENRHRPLAIWNRYGNWSGDPLARFNVTHAALMQYIDEIGYYRRRFPDAMAAARQLDEWVLWKTRVWLFELPRRDAPSPSGGSRTTTGDRRVAD